jgi:hypothetical protein
MRDREDRSIRLLKIVLDRGLDTDLEGKPLQTNTEPIAQIGLQDADLNIAGNATRKNGARISNELSPSQMRTLGSLSDLLPAFQRDGLLF